MVLNLATQLGRLGSVLVRAGEFAVALKLVASSEALTGSLGADPAWWASGRNIETMELVRSQLDPAEVERLDAEGRALTLDEAVALAVGGPA